MSEPVTAARPYARAAFEVAHERGGAAQWSQMLAALATVVADPAVGRLIGNPRYSTAQVADFIVAVLGDALDKERRNFVRLLAANRRLRLARDVAALFEQYRADDEHSSVAEIVSARALSDAQRDALCRAIKRYTGREVTATCRTDETLLGGAVVRIGDFVVDGSLRTKLEKLSQTLAH